MEGAGTSSRLWLIVDFGISEVVIVGSRNTLTAACMLNASLNDPQENK